MAVFVHIIQAIWLCVRYLIAYIASLAVAMSIAGAPIFGPSSLFVAAVVLLGFPQIFYFKEAFWLYYSLLPTFFAIIAADRFELVIYQRRFGRRVFLALVGGVIGGTTSTTMLANFLSTEGFPSFSYDTIFDYLVVSLSGVPAGMLLGALMPARKAELVRSRQCTGR